MKYVASGVGPVSTDNICSTSMKVEGGCVATRTALAIRIVVVWPYDCGQSYVAYDIRKTWRAFILNKN